jgi:murein DD-endopeptidase MepM/ murein hydrolase activator NlpD
MVDVAHAGGVLTRYGHLSKIAVRPGQKLRAGSLVGFEGATGNVTGPHLHFEVHRGATAIDPLPFLRDHGVRVPGS